MFEYKTFPYYSSAKYWAFVVRKIEYNDEGEVVGSEHGTFQAVCGPYDSEEERDAAMAHWTVETSRQFPNPYAPKNE